MNTILRNEKSGKVEHALNFAEIINAVPEPLWPKLKITELQFQKGGGVCRRAENFEKKIKCCKHRQK